MAQILTYHVLQAATSDALAASVQAAIRSDWQPYGNMTVAVDKAGTTYSQPIVQYLPEAPQIPVSKAMA
jgi:hypothetical protein